MGWLWFDLRVLGIEGIVEMEEYKMMTGATLISFIEEKGIPN